MGTGFNALSLHRNSKYQAKRSVARTKIQYNILSNSVFFCFCFFTQNCLGKRALAKEKRKLKKIKKV